MKLGRLEGLGLGGVGPGGQGIFEPAVSHRELPGGLSSPGAVLFFRRHLPWPTSEVMLLVEGLPNTQDLHLVSI